MLATEDQLNQILGMCWELHLWSGKSCTEIGRALLTSNTLRSMGYTGGGRVTYEQAQAEIRLLERWIEQAKPKG